MKTANAETPHEAAFMARPRRGHFRWANLRDGRSRFMPRYPRFELALFGIALAAIVLAVILAGESWHGRPAPPSNTTVDRGIAALRAFDYAAARREFTKAATAGDTKGQIWLADMM